MKEVHRLDGHFRRFAPPYRNKYAGEEPHLWNAPVAGRDWTDEGAVLTPKYLVASLAPLSPRLAVSSPASLKLKSSVNWSPKVAVSFPSKKVQHVLQTRKQHNTTTFLRGERITYCKYAISVHQLKSCFARRDRLPPGRQHLVLHVTMVSYRGQAETASFNETHCVKSSSSGNISP